MKRDKKDQGRREADMAKRKLYNLEEPEDTRYARQLAQLRVYAYIKPCVYRFVRVCGILKDCFQIACRAPVDMNVASYRWLQAGFTILSGNPHEDLQGDDYFNFSQDEQRLMQDAVGGLIGYLVKWSRKVTPRHKDTHYVDELEVTIQNEVDFRMAETIHGMPGRKPWDFIFEQDENTKTVEFTGELFACLLRHCRLNPWHGFWTDPRHHVFKSPSDELASEHSHALLCSEPGYLKRRLAFMAFCNDVRHMAGIEKTSMVDAPTEFADLGRELEKWRPDDTWGEMPSAEEEAEYRSRFAASNERRRTAVGRALQLPEPEVLAPEPPPKTPLEQIGDDIRSTISRAESSSSGFRAFPIAHYLQLGEKLLRAALKRNLWGVFANPLWVKLMIAIQSRAGGSCEIGTEDQAFEGAWTSFSAMLSVYYKRFIKAASGHELPDLLSWLGEHRKLTYAVEDTPSLPDVSGEYRGISGEICNGLYDISKQIAVECHSNGDELEQLYSDAFPDSIDWNVFPALAQKTIPLESRYKRVEDEIALQLFDNPSMDGYMATCKALTEGVSIAVQASDAGLPSRAWFRRGLEILIRNPHGNVTFETQHLQYYTDAEADWIMGAFMPLAVSLKDWAKKMHPADYPIDALADEILDCDPGIPLVTKIEELVRQHTCVDADAGGFRVNWFPMIFEDTSYADCWKYKSNSIQQLCNALAAPEAETRIVPVKTRRTADQPPMEPAATNPAESIPATDTSRGTATVAMSDGAPEVKVTTIVTDSESDPWEEFYGEFVHWYKITEDGSTIIDYSKPDDESIYRYKAYSGISGKAKGTRIALASLFAHFRDEMKWENGQLVSESGYHKFPNGRTGYSSLYQMTKCENGTHSIMEFMKSQAEHSNGGWRIINKPSDKWPPDNPQIQNLIST